MALTLSCPSIPMLPLMGIRSVAAPKRASRAVPVNAVSPIQRIYFVYQCGARRIGFERVIALVA